MRPGREREVLVAFEVLGPERVRMAANNAYPRDRPERRGDLSHCFIGCATTQAERLVRFPRYNYVKGLFDRSVIWPVEVEYECGDHERLRALAMQWLAGVESPPKERRFARVGVALMLLLLVLL